MEAAKAHTWAVEPQGKKEFMSYTTIILARQIHVTESCAFSSYKRNKQLYIVLEKPAK
jgi:hypothetical protein